MVQYIDKDALVAEIKKLSAYLNSFHVQRIMEKILFIIDTLEVQEETVSEDLVDATNNYCVNVRKGYPRVMDETDRYICNAFKAGAKWKAKNLWKPADGDDLPKIGREVIALLDNGKVVYAHQPSAYWDGKNIDTGKVTRYYPKTYDKGGWNIPNLKYWLDCPLPE